MRKSTTVKMHYEDLRGRLVTKKEDDVRRHKKKCKYYLDGFCNKNIIKCYGSTHCVYYREREMNQQRKIIRKVDTNIVKKVEIPIVQKIDNHPQKVKVKLVVPHVVIHVSRKTYKKLFQLCREKTCCIDLILDKVSQFFEYDNFKFEIIYLQVDKDLILCGINPQKIEIIRSGDFLTIHLPIVRFHENKTIDFDTKTLWQAKDSLYGNVEFRVKKKKSRK